LCAADATPPSIRHHESRHFGHINGDHRIDPLTLYLSGVRVLKRISAIVTPSASIDPNFQLRNLLELQMTNRTFLRQAERIIKATPGHPLEKLINPQTGMFWGKKLISEIDKAKPTFQAGHLTSRWAGGETVALQDAYGNWFEGLWEGKSEAIFRQAIDIGGVPIERGTAQYLEFKGLIPKGSVENAKRCAGWKSGDKLTGEALPGPGAAEILAEGMVGAINIEAALAMGAFVALLKQLAVRPQDNQITPDQPQKRSRAKSRSVGTDQQNKGAPPEHAPELNKTTAEAIVRKLPSPLPMVPHMEASQDPNRYRQARKELQNAARTANAPDRVSRPQATPQTPHAMPAYVPGLSFPRHVPLDSSLAGRPFRGPDVILGMNYSPSPAKSDGGGLMPSGPRMDTVPPVPQQAPLPFNDPTIYSSPAQWTSVIAQTDWNTPSVQWYKNGEYQYQVPMTTKGNIF
jgi:hypothetical protein